MNYIIRKAKRADIPRIAEILVFVKRISFFPIFKDEEYAFNELQVLSVANECAAPELLEQHWVYDDGGIIKGLMRIEGEELATLYVDHFFQSQGIGARLLDFAVRECGVRFLWALEKNEGAVRFYARHGFLPSGERKLEEGTSEFLVRLVRSSERPAPDCRAGL